MQIQIELQKIDNDYIQVSIIYSIFNNNSMSE